MERRTTKNRWANAPNSSRNSRKSAPTLDIPIRIWRGNLYNREYQDAINPIDHVSAYQQDNAIVDIPLTDDKALLDQFTAWSLEVGPGLIISMRLYVALRSA